MNAKNMAIKLNVQTEVFAKEMVTVDLRHVQFTRMYVRSHLQSPVHPTLVATALLLSSLDRVVPSPISLQGGVSSQPILEPVQTLPYRARVLLFLLLKALGIQQMS